MGNLNEFYDRSVIFMVVLYKSAKKYKPDDVMMKTWRKLGNKNQEWYKVYGVDCLIESEICGIVFDTTDKDLDSYIYPITTGERKTLTGYVTSVQNISGMAMKMITDFELEELYEQNYSRITGKANAKDLKFAVLFTEKHITPKIWKLLADRYAPYITFSTAGSVNKPMVEKFGVTEFPTLIVLPDPSAITSAVEYKGEFKKEGLVEFLDEFKKPIVNEWVEFTTEMIESGKYCTGEDPTFCLIYK